MNKAFYNRFYTKRKISKGTKVNNLYKVILTICDKEGI